jgi:hypothetical protein
MLSCSYLTKVIVLQEVGVQVGKFSWGSSSTAASGFLFEGALRHCEQGVLGGIVIVIYFACACLLRISDIGPMSILGSLTSLKIAQCARRKEMIPFSRFIYNVESTNHAMLVMRLLKTPAKENCVHVHCFAAGGTVAPTVKTRSDPLWASLPTPQPRIQKSSRTTTTQHNLLII